MIDGLIPDEVLKHRCIKYLAVMFHDLYNCGFSFGGCKCMETAPFTSSAEISASLVVLYKRAHIEFSASKWLGFLALF